MNAEGGEAPTDSGDPETDGSTTGAGGNGPIDLEDASTDSGEDAGNAEDGGSSDTCCGMADGAVPQSPIDGSLEGDPLPPGAPCTDGTQCESGHCPPDDGVCCDVACEVSCLACSEAKTGYDDGICAPVMADTDPDLECGAEAAETCGNDGTGCNGELLAPGCNLHDSSTLCAPLSCNEDFETEPRYCNGAGTCTPAPAPTSCGAYRCDLAGASCLVECQGDEDCHTSYECNEDGECVPLSASATIEWVETWESLFVLDGINITLLELRADADGNAAFVARCGALIGSLGCNSSTTDAELYRVDATTRQLWAQDLGFRAIDASLAVDASGGLAVGKTTNWSGGCCSAGLETYDAAGDPGFSRSYSSSTTVSNSWVTVTGLGSVTSHFDNWPDDFAQQDYGGGPIAGPVLVKYNAAGVFVWHRPWTNQVPLEGEPGGGFWFTYLESDATAVGCPATAGSNGLVVSHDYQNLDFGDGPVFTTAGLAVAKLSLGGP